MTMTSEEIVREYNQASNKNKQIRILADLNCCSPSEILQVLAQAGVEGVKEPKRIRQRKQAAPEAVPEAPPVSPAGIPPFYNQVEAILSALPETITSEAEGHTQNLLQTLFADYLHHRLKGRVHDEA